MIYLVLLYLNNAAHTLINIFFYFHGSRWSVTPVVEQGDESQEEEEEEEEEKVDEDRSGYESQLLTCMRRSLVFCAVEKMEDVGSREEKQPISIGLPTEVRHVAHVTFDRYQGFLGVPTELEPDVNTKAPSASAKVFGVSTKSMQCAYDSRGNSVPMILLMLQNRLYAQGGLREEGIFRLAADNSEAEHVRDQLNSGIVPDGIDVHCLSGLIKAWFRELPDGVLDCLTPEQVLECESEEDYIQLVSLVPPTESALLDWGINLMADIVQEERYNKMNEHNVATVFAPNMSQVSDPLIALMHAVQVMNFLKTLISKVLRERSESTQSYSVSQYGRPSPSSESVQSKDRAGENLLAIKTKFDQTTMIFEDEEREQSKRAAAAVQGSSAHTAPVVRPNTVNSRRKKGSGHVKKLSLDVNKLPKRYNDNNKHGDF